MKYFYLLSFTGLYYTLFEMTRPAGEQIQDTSRILFFLLCNDNSSKTRNWRTNNYENLWRNDVLIFTWHSVGPTNKSNHVWQVAKFICCRHICCKFHINTCFDRSIHFLQRLNLFCRFNVERVLFELVAHLVYVHTVYMNFLYIFQ